MNDELKRYEVEPDPFWSCSHFIGDGYNMMEAAERRGWTTIAGWGRDGWDLGSWPYVMVFCRKRDEQYLAVQYCEGDITMYACPSLEIRNAIIDEIAFFYWKHRDEEWVKPYQSVEELPAELKGPYSTE